MPDIENLMQQDVPPGSVLMSNGAYAIWVDAPKFSEADLAELEARLTELEIGDPVKGTNATIRPMDPGESWRDRPSLL